MGYVTQTTAIRGSSVIPRLALYILHLHTKSGDSRFSHSGDITRVHGLSYGIVCVILGLAILVQ